MRSQLDALAMKRLNSGFSLDDRVRYREFCLREQELLRQIAA